MNVAFPDGFMELKVYVKLLQVATNFCLLFIHDRVIYFTFVIQFINNGLDNF